MTVEIVHKAGADLTSQPHGGHNVLSLANERDHHARVQVLLKNTSARSMALHIAVESVRSTIVEILIKAGGNTDPLLSTDSPALIKAIHRGDMETVDIQIKPGADVSEKPAEGGTPLQLAVWGPEPRCSVHQ